MSLSRESSTLTQLGAAELARLVAAGKASTREVVEAHIARIEAVNRQINAVCVPMFDQAREEAARSDEAQSAGRTLGPLHGVPVTIKECFHVSGTPSTMGLTTLRDEVIAGDGPLVAQLRAAGAIILGKTNVPQLMILHETDNPLYGRTNNPWNVERTPGGSSGGEAAIIAAGGSPLGLGSDLGGSIRIPAHFCGIHGLKPTSGRLTTRGLVENLRGMYAIRFQPGPMARRVEDLELMLRVFCDEAVPRSAGIDAPPLRLPPSSSVNVQQLRIAAWSSDGLLPPGAPVARVVREAIAALREAGATVEEIDPPNMREALRLYFGLLGADGGRDFRRLARGSQLDPRVRRLLRLAATPRWLRPAMALRLRANGQGALAEIFTSAGPRSADEYWRLAHRKRQFALAQLRRLEEEQFDAVVCPPHALPAVLHGHGGPDLMPAASHTLLMNLLEVPCGVVAAGRARADEESAAPATHSPNRSVDAIDRRCRVNERGMAGLPVGVQVAARPWREDLVLSVMSALEVHFRRSAEYPVIAEAAGHGACPF